MIKAFIVVLAGLFQTVAMAATTKSGHTTNDEHCAVVSELESHQIAFTSDSGGFGFEVDGNEIKTRLSQGERSIIINGQDGSLSAQLRLNFDAEGNIISANYSEKSYIFTKEIFCRHMH